MDLMKESYYALLDTPTWKAFRLDYFRRKGNTCEICHRHLKRGLQVHHRRYFAERKPWEYSDADLQCLCTDCHRALHMDLVSRGKTIPVYDDVGNPFVVPDEACCRFCGGSGFKEEYPALLGGLCFRCFGSGLRYVHRYTRDEARRYSFKIYNQWLTRHEDQYGKVNSDLFKSAADVEHWLLSLNDKQ